MHDNDACLIYSVRLSLSRSLISHCRSRTKRVCHTVIVYLSGYVVWGSCLKMWKHHAVATAIVQEYSRGMLVHDHKLELPLSLDDKPYWLRFESAFASSQFALCKSLGIGFSPLHCLSLNCQFIHLHLVFMSRNIRSQPNFYHQPHPLKIHFIVQQT